MKKIKSREAVAIINALSGGVVPNIGLHNITVGRDLEVQAVVKSLKDVSGGHGAVKFWIGDFGSGKSFILQLIQNIATQKGFVVASANFTPELRLYSNDRRAVNLYSKLIHSLATKESPGGNALPLLLDKWLEASIDEVSSQQNLSRSELLEEDKLSLLADHIIQTCKAAINAGGYELGLVVSKYLEGFASGNDRLKQQALKWLMGEYTTLTEARQDLGVRVIIDDRNYYDMLKNLSLLFKKIGYHGLVINLDEAVNLYKIAQTPVRDKNYEKLLSIYNDCLQSSPNHMFFNIAGIREFLVSEQKGLFSYHALKTRLATNSFAKGGLRDYDQPVIELRPLDNDEIFQLLKLIQGVFGARYADSVDLDDVTMRLFMENLLNREGGSSLLTPRETTRDFIDLLSVIRQNPDNKSELIAQLSPATTSSSDEIEIL